MWDPHYGCNKIRNVTNSCSVLCVTHTDCVGELRESSSGRDFHSLVSLELQASKWLILLSAGNGGT